MSNLTTFTGRSQPNFMREIHNKKKEKIIIPKTKYEENIKTIYTEISSKNFQKDHPFGQSEKRFEWQFLSTGEDIKNRKRCKQFHSDCLEGGIGNFMSKNCGNKVNFNNFDNKKKINYNKFVNNKYIRNGDTKRVIFPNENKELLKPNNKRILTRRKGSIDASMNTLFKKTPISIYPLTYKRKLNASMEYSYKEINMFSEEFLNDKKYNRIFGVPRKIIANKMHMETEPPDLFSFGRRHFKDKMLVKTQIY